MQALIFFKLNDTLVELRSLRFASDPVGTYVTTGTITADVYDTVAAAVISGSAISLSYVAASTGLWRGTLPYNITLSSTGTYILRVTAVCSGVHGYWEPTLSLQTQPII
jgi:hypothetical protein